jgi:hypothetical protein
MRATPALTAGAIEINVCRSICRPTDHVRCIIASQGRFLTIGCRGVRGDCGDPRISHPLTASRLPGNPR